MKKIVFIAAALLMAGCSREFVEKIYDVNYEPTNRFANNLAELPGQFEKDTAALDALINSFSGNIQKRWGGKKEIKYAAKVITSNISITTLAVPRSTFAKA